MAYFRPPRVSWEMRKFRDVEELQKVVDAYFQNPINTKKIYNKDGDFVEEVPVYTVCGMAYSLGFKSRQSIYDYLKRKNELSDVIEKAKFFIESNYEALLQSNNVAGIIFALKNMGWKDSYEVDQTINDRSINPKTQGMSDDDVLALARRKAVAATNND